MRFAVLPSFALTVAACSGGGGHGRNDGGYLRVEHVLAANGGEATFARAELGDRISLDRPGSGECEAPSQEIDADATWLDAGPSIALVESGGATIELTRASIGTRIVYGADGLAGSLSPAGARYDAIFAGSDEVEADTWASVVRIPEPVVPGPLFNQIGFFAEQVVEWTPSGDADEVIVEFGSGSQVTLACRVSGSRSKVTLSEQENNTLEPSGGTITFRAIRRGSRDGVVTEGQNVVVTVYE